MGNQEANEPLEKNESEGAEGSDEKLGEPGLRALQKVRAEVKTERERAKNAESAVAELQAQIDALNAEKLSDLEKAQLEAQRNADRAVAAEREVLRYKYAAKHGISDEDAELFLTGDTEEVVAAQAERLAGRKDLTGVPKPDLTQGGSGLPPQGSTSEQFANFIESKLN